MSPNCWPHSLLVPSLSRTRSNPSWPDSISHLPSHLAPPHLLHRGRT
jgi:hypothetical protein